MGSNFCASYLKYIGSEIFDELGNPVNTICYTDEIYPVRYSKPSIIYDFLEAEGEKKSIVKELKGIKHVEKLGYSLCSVMPPREWGWKGNAKAVILVKTGGVDERYAKRLKDMRNCVILFDEANLRLKLIGAKAGINGEGPWIDLK